MPRKKVTTGFAPYYAAVLCIEKLAQIRKSLTNMNIIFETDRLRLRWMEERDAGFINQLLNDQDFIRYIGDRGVHNDTDAIAYINDGPIAMYQKEGFGLFLVETKSEETPIGICGILKRPELEDADLGYAFLPFYRGQGYALESVRATLQFAWEEVRLKRIAAIVDRENTRSIHLLEKMAFRLDGEHQPNTESKPLLLYRRSNETDHYPQRGAITIRPARIS